MTWSLVDDQFHGHPKITGGGPLVELIQQRAIAYCNRYLTDGFISTEMVPTLLAGLETLTYQGIPAVRTDWVAVLLERRLWERADGGYTVHDFAQYNLSRAEVLRRRENRRRSGQLGAERRWGLPLSPRDSPRDPIARAMGPAIADAMADAIKMADAKDSPSTRHNALPYPYPDTESPPVIAGAMASAIGPTQRVLLSRLLQQLEREDDVWRAQALIKRIEHQQLTTPRQLEALKQGCNNRFFNGKPIATHNPDDPANDLDPGGA